MKLIEIVPYDTRWPTQFEALRQVYVAALDGDTVSVEHVGSTSVPGLAAKPILDIDLVIPSRRDLAPAVRRLARLGYRHQGDLGIVGREAFSRDGADDVPRDGSGRQWPEHHLYVCAADSEELHRHLAFRAALRADPRLVEDYAALKRALAERFRHDRDAYSTAKTEFVQRVLADARQLIEGESARLGQE